MTIYRPMKHHQSGCPCDTCRAKRARRMARAIMWARELARRRRVADTNGDRQMNGE
jgi:hypothetical protein